MTKELATTVLKIERADGRKLMVYYGRSTNFFTMTVMLLISPAFVIFSNIANKITQQP